MLTIKPVAMFLVAETWHNVVDEKGGVLGAFPREESAIRYKNRLQESGINSAEDMIDRCPDARRKALMRSLMLSGVPA